MCGCGGKNIIFFLFINKCELCCDCKFDILLARKWFFVSCVHLFPLSFSCLHRFANCWKRKNARHTTYVYSNRSQHKSIHSNRMLGGVSTYIRTNFCSQKSVRLFVTINQFYNQLKSVNVDFRRTRSTSKKETYHRHQPASSNSTK